MKKKKEGANRGKQKEKSERNQSKGEGNSKGFEKEQAREIESLGERAREIEGAEVRERGDRG